MNVVDVTVNEAVELSIALIWMASLWLSSNRLPETLTVDVVAIEFTRDTRACMNIRGNTTTRTVDCADLDGVTPVVVKSAAGDADGGRRCALGFQQQPVGTEAGAVVGDIGIGDVQRRERSRNVDDLDIVLR